MQKTVVYCDMCGKPEAHRFSFAVDSQMDGAGDTDEIHAEVDLCAICAVRQLDLFIRELPWPSRERLAKGILKDKRFYLSQKASAATEVHP